MKRTGDELENGPSKRSAPALAVQKERIRVLRPGSIMSSSAPVIYWMSREQRVRDNWALLYALEQAGTTSPVAVAFNLVPEFLGAGARMFGFMLRGLKELEPKLKVLNIEFFLLQGDPVTTIPELVKSTEARLLVTDFSPLRLGKQWRDEVAQKVSIPVHEVDAHNVVPVWTASNKRETAARTIRPKINGQLPKFLKEFPEVKSAQPWVCEHKPTLVDWDNLIAVALEKGKAVPEVTWCKPGEDAAMDALLGPAGFLSPGRLSQYESKRNDPASPQALSNLSPYFHFGQLAPQRAALEASKFKSKYKASVEGFLEEMIVRRELSDNFCFYTANYDRFDCALEWAKETLRVHEKDKREYLYTEAQLEAAKTHDELWNATQMEMVYRGKMHGYMRMYWAKKILEWTPNAQEAIRIAVYLNDKYELDGRDPNGYVGVMWSMVGIHDQGWAERPVFGKIRYMNYNGCKRKFNVPGYVSYVNRMVRDVKQALGAPDSASIFAKAASNATGGASTGSKAAVAAAATGKAAAAVAKTKLAAAKPGATKPATTSRMLTKPADTAVAAAKPGGSAPATTRSVATPAVAGKQAKIKAVLAKAGAASANNLAARKAIPTSGKGSVPQSAAKPEQAAGKASTPAAASTPKASNSMVNGDPDLAVGSVGAPNGPKLDAAVKAEETADMESLASLAASAGRGLNTVAQQA